MTGDLMNKVFGDIKTKKSDKALSDKALNDETLSNKSLSNETLSINVLNDKGLSLKLVDEAIAAATSKRRMIGVWSPVIAACMWYLKETIPRFSISEVAASWIEAGLERDYPELVKAIKAGMKKSN